MDTKIVPQTPTKHCHVCHEPTIAKVCHHCGKGLCDKDHDLIARSVDYDSLRNEYKDLGLEAAKYKGEAIHCSDCAKESHTLKRNRWVARLLLWFGLGILILGIYEESGPTITQLFREILSLTSISVAYPLDLLAPTIGAALLVSGMMIWLFQRHRWNRLLYRNNRPLFPVIPEIRMFTITENMNGKIVFDSIGQYSSSCEQGIGELVLEQHFTNSDKERLNRYRKKHKLSHQGDIEFHAGFVVFEGELKAEFTGVNFNEINTIPLTDRITNYPFLISENGNSSSEWKHKWDYIVSAFQKSSALPIQIIPTLVLDRDHKAIDLVVQIAPQSKFIRSSKSITIEKLSLRSPQRLGAAKGTQPNALVHNIPDPGGSESVIEICWQKVNFKPKSSVHKFTAVFENKLERAMVLSGQLHLSFDGSLSEIKSVSLFLPWGEKRDIDLLTGRTHIRIEFELNLQSLLFQETKSLPWTEEHRGVTPDHSVVTALTEKLNENDIYVKRVIENPSRTSKADAQITNRFWDVAGRYYEGIFPIDFHMAVTSEEVHGQSDQSKMCADITVQGYVTNEELSNKVDYLKQQLSEIVKQTLKPATENNSHTTSQSSSADTAKINAILELQKKLDEALLEGRIPEYRYEEMHKRYNKQLAGLNYTLDEDI